MGVPYDFFPTAIRYDPYGAIAKRIAPVMLMMHRAS
jgi:hypothetical protein